MNDDEFDQAYELYDALWEEIHNLVDTRLSDLDPDVEEMLRTKLTGEFRFWKRRRGIASKLGDEV